MAPQESTTYMFVERAMDIPVVNDVVSEVTKLTDPISPFIQEGFKIIKDKATQSMSQDVQSKVGSCVESLDSYACAGLETLTTTVPVLTSTTPELLETTKVTAFNYVDSAQEYIASFKIARLGIRIVDTCLSGIWESPIVPISVATKVRGIRRHLRAVRRAGAKRDGVPSNEGSLLMEMAKLLKLNVLLGFVGMQLVSLDEEKPLASSPLKNKGSEVVVKKEVIEDGLEDPDYVPNGSASEDSLEYRSDDAEVDLDSQDDEVMVVAELEDCPTTPNCVKVDHKTLKLVEKAEEDSEEESEDEPGIENGKIVDENEA